MVNFVFKMSPIEEREVANIQKPSRIPRCSLFLKQNKQEAAFQSDNCHKLIELTSKISVIFKKVPVLKAFDVIRHAASYFWSHELYILLTDSCYEKTYQSLTIACCCYVSRF